MNSCDTSDWVTFKDTPWQKRVKKGLEGNELIVFIHQFLMKDDEIWFCHAQDLLEIGKEMNDCGFGQSELPDYLQLERFMFWDKAAFVEDL